MTLEEQADLIEAETEIRQLRSILTSRLGPIDDRAEYRIYAALIEAGWIPPGGLEKGLGDADRTD